MKIAIMGTPVTSGNRGVLALGSSLINLCTKWCGASEVSLMLVRRSDEPAQFRVGGTEVAIRVVNARLSPRCHPRNHLVTILLLSLIYRILPFGRVRKSICAVSPWIREIVDSDHIGDVHGGDSFSDIYGMMRLGEMVATDLSVLLVKKTMIQFPQTYGPYKSRTARWAASFILRRSSLIIARDRMSRDIAQQLAGPKRTVLLSPDVAFSLEPITPATIALFPSATRNSGRAVVGLNVNGLMYNGGYTRNNMFGLKLDYPTFLKNLLKALLQQHSGDVWLVPHTFAPNGNVESDQEAARKLRQALAPDLQNRVRIVDREYDQNEIKGIIGQCEFFIGSRMHACIAALSQGVPCIGVAYSMKFAGVFESVGMQDWVIDATITGTDQAVERAMELHRLKDNVRDPLKQAADFARSQLTQIFSSIAAQPTTPKRTT